MKQTKLQEEIAEWTERFAKHTLRVDGTELHHRIFRLCEHTNRWANGIVLVETPERYFLHGDYDQVTGLSVLGYRAEDIFFGHHATDYVWNKFIWIGRPGARPSAEMRRMGEAAFYGARARFLEAAGVDLMLGKQGEKHGTG